MIAQDISRLFIYSYSMYHLHSLLYSLDEKLTPTLLKKWLYSKESYDLDPLSERMASKHIISMVAWENLHYTFSPITWSPYVVYALWNISLLDSQLLGIVWPRKTTPYMCSVIEDFFTHARWREITTISWWAEWIDTLCHSISLQLWIPTIVVLWWWLWYYLSSSKRSFLENVVAKWWLILSEFRLKQKPAPWTFPQRNRIIAGLSRCIFTPWAGKRSWTLISVDFANQMNTPTYTVPASIYDTASEWSNRYLSEWKIKSTTNFKELLDEHFPNSKMSHISLSEVEFSPSQRKILDSFSRKTEHSVESLVDHCELLPWLLLGDIAELELLWYIRESSPGKRKRK